MSQLIQRSVLTKQPRVLPFRPDWSNPITRGLILLWTGNSMVDCVNGIVESPITLGVSIQSGSSGGLGFKSSSSTTGGWNSAVLPSSLRPTSVTTFWYGEFDGSPANANPRIIDIAPNQTNASPFLGCGCYRPNVSDITYSWNNPAFQSVNVASIVPASGIPCSMSMSTTPSGNVKGYFNGALKVNQASGGTIAYTNPSIVLGTAAGASCTANTTAVVAAVWSRQLSDIEQLALSDNPWQLFRPAMRRLWASISAAPVTGMVPSMMMVMP